MSQIQASDSVEWMRERWEENGVPRPAQFGAMASLLRATAVVTDEVDRVLKGVELTRTGWLVMITLQMSDDHARPLGQLSKVLLVHPTTVTMVIDQLEKAKLVTRKPHPTDRRTVLAKLTAKGLAVVHEANEALGAVSFGMGGIDDAMADRITDDLRTVRRGIGDPG
jgi:DNA-binding MarR family transcriptional regulator